jgi:hypothetical protein
MPLEDITRSVQRKRKNVNRHLSAIKIPGKLVLVVLACNSSTWETKAGGSQV